MELIQAFYKRFIKSSKLATLIFLTFFSAILISGCLVLPGVKPFKLDITVDFKEQTTEIIGTDQQGKVVFNHTYTKEAS